MNGDRSDHRLTAMDALENAKQVNKVLGIIKDLFWQSRNEIEWRDEELGDLLHLIHSKLEETLDEAERNLT